LDYDSGNPISNSSVLVEVIDSYAHFTHTDAYGNVTLEVGNFPGSFAISPANYLPYQPKYDLADEQTIYAL